MKAQLVSVNAVADSLGVSLDTIRRLIRAKRISSVRVGKRVLISQEEVDRIMQHGVPQARRGYDPKCDELARYFLPGDEGLPFTEEDVALLAQAIQDRIEDHLRERQVNDERDS